MNKIILTILSVLLIMACTIDSYETGTGEYSLTRADFVEVQTNSDGQIFKAITDDNVELILTSTMSASWANKPDSVYRGALYYTLVDASSAEVSTLLQVPVLIPFTIEDDEEMQTDPVIFESAWLSDNGKYINLGLYVKNGVSDDETALHIIGALFEGKEEYSDSTSTANIIFWHSQGDVPQYYSSKLYVSIPCSQIDADTATITINTYDGIIKKQFIISHDE